MNILNKFASLLCSGLMLAAYCAEPAGILASAGSERGVMILADQIYSEGSNIVPYTVRLENCPTGFAGCGIMIELDEQLRFMYAADYTPIYTPEGAFASLDLTCYTEPERSNRAVVAAYSEENAAEAEGSLEFQVILPPDAAPNLRYPVRVYVDELFDQEGEDVAFRVSDGWIEITERVTTTSTVPTTKDTTEPTTENTTELTTAVQPVTTTPATAASTTKGTVVSTTAGTHASVTYGTIASTTMGTLVSTTRGTLISTTRATTPSQTGSTAASTTRGTVVSTTKGTSVSTMPATESEASTTTTVTTVKTTPPLASVRIECHDQYDEAVVGAVLLLSGETVLGQRITFNSGSIENGTDNTVVESPEDSLVWISGTGDELVFRLPDGAYTLHEITAPTGFTRSSDLTFVVTNGKLAIINGKRAAADSPVILKNERTYVATTTTTTATTVTTTTTATTATTTATASTSAPAMTSESDTSTSASTTLTTLTTTAESTVSTVNSCFVWGFDNWGFVNSKKTLGKLDQKNRQYLYDISEADKDLLFSKLSNVEIQKISNILEKKTKGSCYGMAVTSILQTYGYFAPSDLVPGAKNLAGITLQNYNEKVRSSVNYYHLLQFTKAVSQYVHTFSRYSDDVKLKKLMESVSAGKPTLLGYTFKQPDGTVSGHAVVAYAIEKNLRVFKKLNDKEGKQFDVRILIYNNNSNDNTDFYNMYINTQTWEWMIPMGKQSDLDELAIMNLSNHRAGNITLVSSDTQMLNYHGMFGGNESYQYDTSAPYYASMSMLPMNSSYQFGVSSDPYDGSFNDENDDGDILLTSSFFADDDDDERTIDASMDSDCSYYLSVEEPERIGASMEYEHCILNVLSEKESMVTFSPKGRIRCENNVGAYRLSMILDEDYHETDWHSLTVEGENGGDLLLTAYPEGKGWLLTGGNLNQVKVSANNYQNAASVTFSTDCRKALIYEIDETTIGIAVDEDENGSFEKTIAQTPARLRGDTNGDGAVDVTDAQLVLGAYTQMLANNPNPLTEEQCSVSDIDGDAVIDAADAQRILMYYVRNTLANNPTTWDEILNQK